MFHATKRIDSHANPSNSRSRWSHKLGSQLSNPTATECICRMLTLIEQHFLYSIDKSHWNEKDTRPRLFVVVGKAACWIAIITGSARTNFEIITQQFGRRESCANLEDTPEWNVIPKRIWVNQRSKMKKFSMGKFAAEVRSDRCTGVEQDVQLEIDTITRPSPNQPLIVSLGFNFAFSSLLPFLVYASRPPRYLSCVDFLRRWVHWFYKRRRARPYNVKFLESLESRSVWSATAKAFCDSFAQIFCLHGFRWSNSLDVGTKMCDELLDETHDHDGHHCYKFYKLINDPKLQLST